VFAGGFLGLALGTALGGWLFVPPGSGLAGPAIALGYGLAAGLATGAAGIFVGLRARIATVRRLALTALAAALLVAAVLSWRLVVSQSELEAAHQEHRAATESTKSPLGR
jgi:hypothetical protein